MTTARTRHLRIADPRLTGVRCEMPPQQHAPIFHEMRACLLRRPAWQDGNCPATTWRATCGGPARLPPRSLLCVSEEPRFLLVVADREKRLPPSRRPCDHTFSSGSAGQNPDTPTFRLPRPCNRSLRALLGKSSRDLLVERASLLEAVKLRLRAGPPLGFLVPPQQADVGGRDDSPSRGYRRRFPEAVADQQALGVRVLVVNSFVLLPSS